MKTLYLLRHAKAEAGGKGMEDTDRPLSARGFEACETIGAALKAKQYKPALALFSPARRTRQTLDGVLRAAGQTPPMREVNKLYLASETEILRIVQGVKDHVSSLLLVGHNPGMHQAAIHLAKVGQSPLQHELDLKYPTGALAVLRFDCKDWSQVAKGEGELIDFMTPKEL